MAEWLKRQTRILAIRLVQELKSVPILGRRFESYWRRSFFSFASSQLEELECLRYPSLGSE